MTVEQVIALARQHYSSGRLNDAEALARQILAIDPNQPDALHVLSVIAYQVGRSAVAIELLTRLIVLQPTVPELLNELGNAYMLARRFDEAILSFRNAIAQIPGSASIYYNLGNALRESGQIDQAIESFQQALRHRPEHVNSLNNLANLLLERGRTEESIAAFNRAVALAPRMPAASYNLARAQQIAGQIDQAIATLRHVIEVAPDSAEACNNLGVLLEEQTRLDESKSILNKAVSLRPDWAEAHCNLGNTLRALGEFLPAIQSYERAVALKPDYALAKYNLGLTHLQLGDWIKGWPGYELRWIANNAQQPTVNCPRWTGQPLNGKRILIHTEQGYGDTLNFVRFVATIAEMGARIALAGPQEMERLLKSVDGVETLTGDDRLVRRDVDFYCPLASLPGLLGTTPANIPSSVPYLRADPQLSEQWRARLPNDGKKKVGIVWTGRHDKVLHRKRSIPRAMFQSLAEVPGVTLASLQKGESPDDVDAGKFEMLDWTSELNDFADTAALIDNLDLVITIDSAVAHLAGAMGKTVWVLLKFVPDWRWLIDREDSVWYPTMKLFRQPAIGDWQTPMGRVAEALRSWAG